ncbi:unnamed protein product [Effrenium voratum]|nr:unnamed protein product [Effrenium voratum]
MADLEGTKMLDDEDSDSDSDSWGGIKTTQCDRRCTRNTEMWLIGLAVSVVLGPVLVVILRRTLQAKVDASAVWEEEKRTEVEKVWESSPVSDATLAIMIGYGRQMRQQASILVDICFGLVFFGTLTATYIATVNPEQAPADFKQKGTLSNMAQDVQQAQGRLWTTSLGLASILLCVSMYTFWIYRCWAPLLSFENNPLATTVLEYAVERRLRTAWAVVPNVGFVLSAMVPSLSNASNYQMVLTAVHNVCAPLSMLFCMVMETVQLHYGENAFAYFFSTEPTPVYGPLTTFQRMRVVLLIEAWLAGLIFVGVQGYLAFCVNRRYWVALVSYYGEVIGIVLAFSLPAAAALDIREFTKTAAGTVMEETASVIPYVYMSGINRTITRLMDE